jgi:hypothetical protein
METTEKQGNALAGTGVGLGAGALGLLLLQNGGLGGILGGNRPPMEPPATQRDLGYERQLTEKDAEIGQLKAQQYADAAVLAAERRLADKIEKIETQLNTTTTTQAVINAQQTGIIATLQNQVMVLNNMTGLYIKPGVMGASEAALNTLKPAAAATAASGN